MKIKALVLVTLIFFVLYTSPVIAQATESEAKLEITLAEEAVLSMKENGFSTKFSSDALSEAKKAFEAANYDVAVKESGFAMSRVERAFEIGDSLAALDLRIQDVEAKQLDVSKAREMRAAAIEAFSNENYDEAEEFVFIANNELNNVEAEYSILRARYNAARDNFGAYVQMNWLVLTVAIVLIAISVGIMYYTSFAFLTRRNLKNLELEKEVLSDLEKKAQEDYFNRRIISRSTYDLRINAYRKRSLEIDDLVPVLRSRIERIERYGFKQQILSE